MSSAWRDAEPGLSGTVTSATSRSVAAPQTTTVEATAQSTTSALARHVVRRAPAGSGGSAGEPSGAAVASAAGRVEEYGSVRSCEGHGRATHPSTSLEVTYCPDVPRATTPFSQLTVGQVAERSGVAVSALHFYERQGLITSSRTASNQRRYSRSALRRIAFIRASQRVGISLARIRAALDEMPEDRPPTAADWERLSAGWRADLDDRIARLQALRDDLTECIGCGCLSLQTCHLANPRDVLGGQGPGARLLDADPPDPLG